VGPGKGALTAHLLNLYPEMTAIEIDERSILYLNEQLPTLKNIMHESVLDVDWKELASK
jgi:16S rRNA A1518/A1519 N6-dimethyltransferase RsmA/KsgA/DIM1 with predicted DNA glycosylase/AP lyase activity